MNSVALGTTVNPKYGIEEDVQQHLVLDGVTWEQYETLRNTLDDFPGLKMIYLAGTLEFFMPSAKHEQSKTILGRLLELYSLEANIRLYGCGYTTYRKKLKSGE